MKSRSVLWATMLLICLLLGVYVWYVVRIYEAHRFSVIHNEASLRRAIRLEPHDAANYDLLGQYFMWDGQDPRAAAAQFQRAVRLNPHESSYWIHLAQSENSLGNKTEEANAVRKAIAVDPTTPDVAWTAANFFLIQGENQEALEELAVVIRNDPWMADAALELGWRAVGDVEQIRQRMPPDPEIYLKFVRLLAAKRQWTAANYVWSSMLALNREFDARSALFYVDALLAKRDVAAAQIAWKQIAERSGRLQRYVTPGNLLVNARFDQEFLNAAFDWHYSVQPGAALEVDSAQSYRGGEALLITYSGSSNQDAGLSQYVPVTPGVRYMASAWVKSEELETANGPQLTVDDGYRKQEFSRSEETLGTTEWHVVRAPFIVAGDSNLVVIRFSRVPGSTLIRGKFWINSLQVLQDPGGNILTTP
jgi:hypothetical protein